jgi:hypothetical protein
MRLCKHAGDDVLQATGSKGSNSWKEEEGSSWYVDFDQLAFVFSLAEVPNTR